MQKLQEVDPEANCDSVIKISNIRSSNRKEHKKVVASKKSGASADSVNR
jgi:hypothetical protein